MKENFHQTFFLTLKIINFSHYLHFSQITKLIYEFSKLENKTEH